MIVLVIGLSIATCVFLIELYTRPRTTETRPSAAPKFADGIELSERHETRDPQGPQSQTQVVIVIEIEWMNKEIQNIQNKMSFLRKLNWTSKIFVRFGVKRMLSFPRRETYFLSALELTVLNNEKLTKGPRTAAPGPHNKLPTKASPQSYISPWSVRQRVATYLKLTACLTLVWTPESFRPFATHLNISMSCLASCTSAWLMALGKLVKL